MSCLTRFELYVGKRNAGNGKDAPIDNKTGAAAVVRNLKAVLESKERHPWHAVVVDPFYSSVLLAIELLGMGTNVIGTIMTNRLGYDANVKEDRASRPASIPRGTFKFSRSVAVPSMVAFQWWDRKPVHYLCTGSAMAEASIGRKVKQVGAITVPCPSAVTDYQRWMGGVDLHNQLRLQRYSLQTSTKFNKYYKSLFLGLVDMALVNAYLSHKEAVRMAGTQARKRVEWFSLLQNQLLQLKPQDFAGVVATPTVESQKRKRTRARHTHAPEQSEDWVIVSGVQKRRQRLCKVCALLRTSKAKKSFATTYFCERCSVDDAKCWLCNKIRCEYKGVAKTCFEIWHDDFDAGESIPPSLGKRVVLRRPGQKAGVRKKTRRELQLRAEDADDESESNSEEYIAE
ncbi:hypothetical protein PF003_g10883 [Phytophthora fragariae]|nr:hypothetical protein PF003_g10883 [Phytophthora fragariae]